MQQSFISIGNIIIQSVINEFGAGTIAGYSAAVKLNNLVITSFTTLANGISNFTAQNLGAGKSERIRDGFKAGLKMVWIISIPLVLLYFFAGKQLLYLFLDNPTNTAIHTGIMFLCILSPFYFVVSAKLVADGILRGAGLMSRFMITTFTDLILRVVHCYNPFKTIRLNRNMVCMADRMVNSNYSLRHILQKSKISYVDYINTQHFPYLHDKNGVSLTDVN